MVLSFAYWQSDEIGPVCYGNYGSAAHNTGCQMDLILPSYHMSLYSLSLIPVSSFPHLIHPDPRYQRRLTFIRVTRNGRPAREEIIQM